MLEAGLGSTPPKYRQELYNYLARAYGFRREWRKASEAYAESLRHGLPHDYHGAASNASACHADLWRVQEGWRPAGRKAAANVVAVRRVRCPAPPPVLIAPAPSSLDWVIRPRPIPNKHVVAVCVPRPTTTTTVTRRGEEAVCHLSLDRWRSSRCSCDRHSPW